MPRAKVEGADIANSFGNRFSIVADGEGRFEVNRAEAAMLVLAASHNLAGAVHIQPMDKTMTVSIGPTASATGTLIDEATGQPAANREVSFAVRLPETGGPFSWQFPQTATTDAKGRFHVTHLTVALKYDAHAEVERNDRVPSPGIHSPTSSRRMRSRSIWANASFLLPTGRRRSSNGSIGHWNRKGRSTCGSTRG